jgi:hypothetical protein
VPTRFFNMSRLNLSWRNLACFVKFDGNLWFLPGGSGCFLPCFVAVSAVGGCFEAFCLRCFAFFSVF